MGGRTTGFILLAALPLGGCAAGLAASAVGTAVGSATRPSVAEGDLGPAAVAACRARAARHGEVHIIDVERRSSGRVIVWGTVQDAAQRRSFECRYDGEIDGFTLRAVRGR